MGSHKLNNSGQVAFSARINAIIGDSSIFRGSGGGIVTIASTGTFSGDGTIAGNVTNNGTILANNITVASTLSNNRVIEGNGRVHANIVNNSAGKIRALGGNNLWLSGPSLNNSGLIEINDGSELQVAAAINNRTPTGLISLRNGF